MVTTQPTPPPNPTTDNEETPPTTPQQPQEPVDPQTTSINDNTNGEIQTDPATDSEGTGTEQRVPTTSETINNPILRPRDTISTAVIAGIIVLVVVIVIVLTLTVVTIITVILKKHGKMNKGRALSNPAYGTQGECNKKYCH